MDLAAALGSAKEHHVLPHPPFVYRSRKAIKISDTSEPCKKDEAK